MDKFKLIAFAIVGVFAIGLVAGFIVLEANGRPTSTFVIFAGGILSSLGIFGGLGYGQVKQSERLETVAKNVNGNSTRMLDTIETQQQQIAGLLAALPATVAAPVDTSPAMSEDTILRLRSDAAQLPSHRAE
ncbi:hypothetical protein [Frigoribacterium sp. PhB118]|uniref:hypothetical protein n=1 Tax=Frigoribacterium sp. PhB118 TaxID=2485175 RepID=UPI000F4645FC|nr:hypothetical protein [Frigoribacterium sp. PhB118]ROS57194.1 hypothetical protein EDF21_0849 [Frigoribacterium sp. PhB118]